MTVASCLQLLISETDTETRTGNQCVSLFMLELTQIIINRKNKHVHAITRYKISHVSDDS